MSSGRARTRITRSGVERTNHCEVTVSLWYDINTSISWTNSLLEKRKSHRPSASCTEASLGSKWSQRGWDLYGNTSPFSDVSSEVTLECFSLCSGYFVRVVVVVMTRMVEVVLDESFNRLKYGRVGICKLGTGFKMEPVVNGFSLNQKTYTLKGTESRYLELF